MGSEDKRQSLLSNAQIWEEICNILPAAFVKAFGRWVQANTETRQFLHNVPVSPNLHIYTPTCRG